MFSWFWEVLFVDRVGNIHSIYSTEGFPTAEMAIKARNYHLVDIADMLEEYQGFVVEDDLILARDIESVCL